MIIVVGKRERGLSKQGSFRIQVFEIDFSLFPIYFSSYFISSVLIHFEEKKNSPYRLQVS